MVILNAKEKLFSVFLAVIHFIATFHSDTIFFQGSIEANLVTVVCLRIVLFLILVVFWDGIVSMSAGTNKKLSQVVGYALPYFLLLLIYMFLYHPFDLMADEGLIFQEALNYNVYPYHFTYLMGAVYILSFMIFPFELGVVIIKLVLQSLACGYCVYRFVEHYGKKGYFCYIVFMLFQTVYNGIWVHRMQYYGLLYLVIITKLIFDYMEKKDVSQITMVLLMIVFSILAIWRKEGIYIVLMAPICLFIAYRVNKIQTIVLNIILFVFILTITYLKQFQKITVQRLFWVLCF